MAARVGQRLLRGTVQSRQLRRPVGALLTAHLDGDPGPGPAVARQAGQRGRQRGPRRRVAQHPDRPPYVAQGELRRAPRLRHGPPGRLGIQRPELRGHLQLHGDGGEMVPEAVMEGARQPVALGRQLLHGEAGALLTDGDGGHRQRQHQTHTEHEQVGDVLLVAVPAGGAEGESRDQPGGAQRRQGERDGAAVREVGGERQQDEEHLGEFGGVQDDHRADQGEAGEQERQPGDGARDGLQGEQRADRGAEAGRTPAGRSAAGGDRRVVETADEHRPVQQRCHPSDRCVRRHDPPSPVAARVGRRGPDRTRWEDTCRTAVRGTADGDFRRPGVAAPHLPA